MKIVRIICLLLVSLLALSPVGNVLAQGDEEAQYTLALTSMTGLYNTTVIAGKDKYFPMEIENLGTEAIDNITFSSDKPSGWTIEFSPDKVDLLEAHDSETVEVIIKPPAGTGEGDYMVTLRASGTQASSKEIDIRTTVKAPTVVEEIAMSVLHPTVEAIAGEDFAFEVEFKYIGPGGVTGESRSFDLRTMAPKGWEVYMTPRYEKEKRISAIALKPAFAYGENTRLVASAPFWPLPEPGEYKITLEAVSGELKDTIELTAVITAKYILFLVPSAERYDTKAEAGRDNYFSVELGNLGTALIDNINFSSDKPQGWAIEFTPDKVDLLEAFDTQTIDVNIKPPPETIAGDYMVTIRASGAQIASERLNIRVTVETPTLWGWVGVGIILVVIVGLVVIFMRFSRR